MFGSYPPPFGGVPRHIEELVPVLVNRGWEVHVVSPGSSGSIQGDGFQVYKEPTSRKLAGRASALQHPAGFRALTRVRLESGAAEFARLHSWWRLGREIIRR